MDAIDWSDKLQEGELDGYFDTEGNINRGRFLKDFTDGGLEIKEDTRDSGNNPADTIQAAIDDEENGFYLLGRVDSIRKGDLGAGSPHEIGIAGLDGVTVDPIGTSDNDSDRFYSTDQSQNQIRRVIIIGETE